MMVFSYAGGRVPQDMYLVSSRFETLKDSIYLMSTDAVPISTFFAEQVEITGDIRLNQNVTSNEFTQIKYRRMPASSAGDSAATDVTAARSD